ncbi:MAG: hypothetical protein Q7S65_01840 [Nanoarchaeota archaeon]|nr:hypothetical protein [Nanoarchaeota archaeon]
MIGLWIVLITAVIFAIIGIVLAGKRIVKTEEYVLARNKLSLSTMVFTLFASGVGSWLLFGPAETLLTAGLVALIGYALSSTLSLWVYGWIGTKIRSVMPEGSSLTEFVLKRFGKPMYLLVLIVSFVYMALAMTAELSGIGLAASVVYGMPAWQTILIIGVLTMIYTAIGGFRASTLTDRIQSYVILPLFALIVVMSLIIMGNFSTAYTQATLPAFGWPGIEYALVLLIGVIAAESFNQVWWQRVYSGKDVATMRKAFYLAGILVFPVVMLAGLLGVYAVQAHAAEAPSIAIFSFLKTLPTWLGSSSIILIVALMMSSMDSLLNGMVSVFTVDIKRVRPKIEDKKLLRVAQVLTLVFALGTMAVATKGMSVLYLFLIADLVCAGAAFPVFYGMFQPRLGKKVAFASCIVGIAVGALLFPNPAFTRGSLFWSFVLAFFLPAVICLAFRDRKQAA